MLKGKKAITPICEARWVHLQKPQTKYNASGVYSVDLILDPSVPEHAEFMQMCQEFSQEVFDDHTADLKPKLKERCKLFTPIREEENEDGEPTGFYIMRVKQNRIIKKRDETTTKFTPKLVDSRGHEIKNLKEAIGNGSELRVAVFLMPFENKNSGEIGVTAKLNAVQIVKLVPYGSSSFDTVDGGYVAKEDDSSPPWEDDAVEDEDL